MSWDTLYLVVSTLSLIVGIYLTIRDYSIRRAKAPSEKDANIASAVQNLSSALGLQTNELVESLTESAKLRDELERMREATRQRVEETAEHRRQQEEEIRKLHAEIEALNRAYAQETQKLRDEVSRLQTLVAESDRRYKAAKDIIEKLVAALRHEKIQMPDIDLDDLSDSVRNWKWPNSPPRSE